jgi:hypothetical protein
VQLDWVQRERGRQQPLEHDRQDHRDRHGPARFWPVLAVQLAHAGGLEPVRRVQQMKHLGTPCHVRRLGGGAFLLAVAFGSVMVAAQVGQVAVRLAGVFGAGPGHASGLVLEGMLKCVLESVLLEGVLNGLLVLMLVFRRGVLARVDDVFRVLGEFREFRALGVLSEFRKLGVPRVPGVPGVPGVLGMPGVPRVLGVLGEFELLALALAPAFYPAFALAFASAFGFGFGPLAGVLNRWILVGHSAHCDRLTSSVTHLPDLQWRHRPELTTANEVTDGTRPYSGAPGTGQCGTRLG